MHINITIIKYNARITVSVGAPVVDGAKYAFP